MRFLYMPQEAGIKHATISVQPGKRFLSKYLQKLVASYFEKSSLAVLDELINLPDSFWFCYCLFPFFLLEPFKS